MFNIILLSSFHQIHGKCNPNELYRIIEEIKPEIIFEELSFDGFEKVYSPFYQPQSIEAITIKAYLQKYHIKHFPVDNYPIIETDLLSNAQVIWEKSNEYRELWTQMLSKIGQEGYSFLNSNECIEMLDKIISIEETVLLEVNNEKLLFEHKAEKTLHEKRENEMLKNIYNYSEHNPYNKAIFLCGVDHRKPLKKKIQEYETNGNYILNWTVYNDL